MLKGKKITKTESSKVSVNEEAAYDKAIENDAVDNPQSTDSETVHKAESVHRPIAKNIFQPNSKYFSIVVYGLAFFALAILIYRFICNFNGTLSFFSSILGMISPFIVGAFIAFVLYPLVHFLYTRVFTDIFKISSVKAAKWLSILFAYVIAIGIISILMVFIVPQVYDSITEISEQLPLWYNSALSFIKDFEANHSSWTFLDYDAINQKIETALPMVVNYLSSTIANLLPVVLNTSMAIVKGLLNFIISIMVSVYMVADHKNLFYHSKRLLYAAMPKKTANMMRRIIHESGRIFSSFIFGKAIDSLIIGILCFISMLIFRFPYAVLISVIVGVTNMIPYFGPFIGGFIGGIIIIIVSPIKVLFFALLILILQQFDGLFLGPKILGDKTGLKPLWVIFSITVGGSLFGVLGMFLGVPCVAVISYILNLLVQHFLNKREVTVTPYESNDVM